MPPQTKSQLLAENEKLRARLAELDARSSEQSGEERLRDKDLTDRKHFDHALQASEVRYRRLFETAKDGILILDGVTGLVTDANPFLTALLGYSHQELLGKALWEIGPFRDFAASKSAFRELQTKEYIRYDNLPLETKDGEKRHVEFVSNVYLVNGSKVIQCNIREITARIQAEDIVRRTHDELSALVTALQRRDTEMQLLNRMNDLLQTCTTQEEAYQVITLMGGELFAGQNGGVAILHAGDPYLTIVARWGDAEVVEPSIWLEDCWAMRRGQPHEAIDLKSSLLCRHFVRAPEAGYLCVPLMVQGETLGLFCLISSSTMKTPHHVGQQQLAVTVSEAIKLSLSNLRLRDKLREQAIHDPLTGLFNRRFLEETLPREMHMARRRKSLLAVAMLDLDNFKRFNDTFGHDAGDSLLRQFGQVLRDKLRRSDTACRYGGDEFVLVLPDSSLEDTCRRVEQIRLLVKRLEIRAGQQLMSTVSVSGGVAMAHEHGSTAHELLRAADDALYNAKHAGSDRLLVYQPKTAEDVMRS